jgi:hypothetical protein
MGVDCYGWVEVQESAVHAGENVHVPASWSGVIRINDLIERNYSVFGYFFDVCNRFASAVAGHRGIPAKVSDEARAEMIDPLRELSREALVNAKLDPADVPGATWVLWGEIVASGWRAHIDPSPGWDLLFALMEQLAVHYSGNGVRLVVWFDSI